MFSICKLLMNCKNYSGGSYREEIVRYRTIQFEGQKWLKH